MVLQRGNDLVRTRVLESREADANTTLSGLLVLTSECKPYEVALRLRPGKEALFAQAVQETK